MKKRKEYISICIICGKPLISTMLFSGSEKYCFNCGKPFPFMNQKSIEATPELKIEKRILEKIWQPFAKYLIPRSSYGRVGCKKCNGKTIHQEHLSKSEKMKDLVATRILDRITR